jgi:hypothetical protein
MAGFLLGYQGVTARRPEAIAYGTPPIAYH